MILAERSNRLGLFTRFTRKSPKKLFLLFLLFPSAVFLPSVDNRDCPTSYTPSYCTPTLWRLDMLSQYNTSFQQVWKVHGLWVERCAECESCGYPSDCKTCNFNISLLAPILPEIKRFWFTPGNLSDFLQHEYCKHGTCTNYTEIEYFNTTLSIYHNVVSRCDESSFPNKTSRECWVYL
uniref:Uncharacterized protein n=1 Tax=viral metagenome TaxID=1070528 RepID=A0A6C0JUR8_9ZZZZ